MPIVTIFLGTNYISKNRLCRLYWRLSFSCFGKLFCFLYSCIRVYRYRTRMYSMLMTRNIFLHFSISPFAMSVCIENNQNWRFLLSCFNCKDLFYVLTITVSKIKKKSLFWETFQPWLWVLRMFVQMRALWLCLEMSKAVHTNY